MRRFALAVAAAVTVGALSGCSSDSTPPGCAQAQYHYQSPPTGTAPRDALTAWYRDIGREMSAPKPSAAWHVQHVSRHEVRFVSGGWLLLLRRVESDAGGWFVNDLLCTERMPHASFVEQWAVLRR